MKPKWKNVPYYYVGPLKFTVTPTALPHKLGFIPNYLKNPKVK
jgi:hypothetical protein